MACVSASKSACILSSMTSDLMVLAPVMPSLKLPVMMLLRSRTFRLARVRWRWKKIVTTVMIGTTHNSSRASMGLSRNMTTKMLMI